MVGAPGDGMTEMTQKAIELGGCGVGHGRKGSEDRCDGSARSWWEDMNPELLALIFALMPADVLSRSVPFVCRSWRDAVMGPYCWSVIDLEDWCHRVDCSDDIDAVVRLLVSRSKGNLRRLSVYRLGGYGFSYAAHFGKRLSVLQIPMSDVTDQAMETYASSLSNLTVLDISFCLKLTYKGIEVLGKHCKSLVQLKRNLPPPEYEATPENGVAAKVDEGEAMAIADSMAGLQHLELSFGRFGDFGLAAILTKCSALRFLDIRGCWSVELRKEVDLMCDKLQTLKDPWCDAYELTAVSSEDEYDNSSVH